MTASYWHGQDPDPGDKLRPILMGAIALLGVIILCLVCQALGGVPQ